MNRAWMTSEELERDNELMLTAERGLLAVVAHTGNLTNGARYLRISEDYLRHRLEQLGWVPLPADDAWIYRTRAHQRIEEDAARFERQQAMRVASNRPI